MSGGWQAIHDDGSGAELTAREVAQATTSYDWLTSVDGVLHWVEASPVGGRTSVWSWRPSWPGVRDLGPADVSVGSGLHAYGGLPYAVLPGGAVAVVDAGTDQVTTGVALTSGAYAHGDLFRADGELFCVREHRSGDELVALDPATRTARVLRATSGFLAAPRVHAHRLAWTQWGAGVMPWDSSEIWVADYQPGGTIGTPMRVAGGPAESAIQPQWGEDGSLYFLSDRTGWWNLYRWRDGQTAAVMPMAAECAAAPWESGYASYVLLPRGRIGIIAQNGPEHRLVLVDPARGVTPLPLPYTSIKPWLAAVDGRIALIGASPTRAQEIACIATDGSDRVDVIRSASPRRRPLSAVAVPEVTRVDSDGAQVTVLFYPPEGVAGSAPLIVRPHPGPTHHSDLRLDWQVQFFTSRGFAVADVDYRGSTGYGRAFRKALDGNWGRLDVQDCRAAALHLLARGRALPGAVFISGASAGGYTALRAISENGPFRLAVARSAIVDPQRWTSTAPRFQRPHAAILTHDDAKIQPARVRHPALLIHGTRDDIAPIDDVTDLATALEERGLLAGMVTLDGVGHYLSTPDALAAALEAELAAYLGVLKNGGPR